MIRKIDHVGIAVKSLDEATKTYEALGFEVEEIEEVAEQKVRVAMLPVGESRIELLEATSEDSAIAKFISSRGEGIHHIAINVENIEEALKKAKEAGLRLIDEKPRIGAGGKKVAFVHPKSTHGVLLEFVEG
ncbi:MAG: methylmalonyl-CoA epimerase [Archaeoglobus sp.]|uniref:methylmalonyl-CoA epimerase n=1 Tax=Archaeoglobus sp. TaxID=1872626 RepID=UPI001D201E1C|nr:methylmalonyl-CoA epimerase [Archaeoglobus sp.]MBO8179533.1 methylmalonyl-CoA epimerase [Archaeoglobus sp.]